uniref:Ig-like domain-containing protein n=1 Tax=Neogobius melanostomus TaxID=47308 RepID=A0A8C6UJ16_9GOBI
PSPLLCLPRFSALTPMQYCLQLREREITAEAGLCTVIHCSFKTPQSFNPSSLVWFKCEPMSEMSVIIFHSKNPNKIQPHFWGRVSLLEPDLSQRNCSIIINDLQLSDSGTYHFRVNRDNDGFSFTFTPLKSITHDPLWPVALQQKPTVQTPALTEGQHSALTCTAPGLCSGSEPTFTWTWRGAGDAPPNVTTATTDPELHGAELSCTVSYKPSSSSTQDSVRINVTCESLRTMMDPPTDDLEVSGDTVVKEGDSLNVTCSVDSFPPSRLMWFGPNKTRLNVSETTESSCQTDLGSASLLIHNVTQAQSGQYMCEGLHLNSSQTRDVHISVKCEDIRLLSSTYCIIFGLIK